MENFAMAIVLVVMCGLGIWTLEMARKTRFGAFVNVTAFTLAYMALGVLVVGGSEALSAWSWSESVIALEIAIGLGYLTSRKIRTF